VKKIGCGSESDNIGLNADVCSIYIDPLNVGAKPKANIVELPCGHQLHQWCFKQLREYRTHRCPICRLDLNEDGSDVAMPERTEADELSLRGNLLCIRAQKILGNNVYACVNIYTDAEMIAPALRGRAVQNFKDALQAHQQALEVNQDHFDSLKRIPKILSMLGRGEEAVQATETALAVLGQSIQAESEKPQLNKEEALLFLWKKLDKAQLLFEKGSALSRQPGKRAEAGSFWMQAQKQGDEVATGSFDEHSPNYDADFSFRAAVAFNIGCYLLDSPKSSSWRRSLLQFGAASRIAERSKLGLQAAISYHKMGVAYDRLKEHMYEIKAYEDAIRCYPEYFDAHMNLGITMLQAAEDLHSAVFLEKAIRHLEVDARARNDPETLETLDRALILKSQVQGTTPDPYMPPKQTQLSVVVYPQ
jgi:tetratricopeptide (TPR) repeat protein